jgi:ElaB/YqjD/DUF883 family membrane-anchored ribosome-binding protein
MARDLGKEASGETSKPASEDTKSTQDDLEALREEVSKLSNQISDILTTLSKAASRPTRATAKGVMPDAQDQDMEATDAIREMGANLIDAIDESLKRRPHTTLAVAAGVGFLLGIIWRR